MVKYINNRGTKWGQKYMSNRTISNRPPDHNNIALNYLNVFTAFESCFYVWCIY